MKPLCMAVINSNEKTYEKYFEGIIYNFGNDFYFQNEEFSL